MWKNKKEAKEEALCFDCHWAKIKLDWDNFDRIIVRILAPKGNLDFIQFMAKYFLASAHYLNLSPF